MENKCPKCGSTNTYVDKKGFSGKKAVAGTLIVGPIGAAAGTIGSNKIKITCLKCGYSYYAGEYSEAQRKLAEKEKPVKITAGGWMVFSFIFSFFTFVIWLIFDSVFFGIQSAVFLGTFLIALFIKIVNNQSIHTQDKKMSKKQREYEKIFRQ